VVVKGVQQGREIAQSDGSVQSDHHKLLNRARLKFHFFSATLKGYKSFLLLYKANCHGVNQWLFEGLCGTVFIMHFYKGF